MNNIRVFLSENFQFLEVKFSIYLNRHVYVMCRALYLSNNMLLIQLYYSNLFDDVIYGF